MKMKNVKYPELRRQYLILGCFWFVLGAFFFDLALRENAPVPFLCATVFFIGGQYYFGKAGFRSSLIRKKVSVGLLSFSAATLRLAAHIALPQLAAGPRTILSATTIHGHTHPDDPAEPPVTICELLSILDRSRDRHITIETHGYKIRAERISALDRFIEEYAGREGAVPQVRGYVVKGTIK